MNSAATGAAGTGSERKLGRWMAVSLVIGNMIGSGAFLLPATLAPLGWSSIGGWLLTIAGGVCLAAVFCWLVRAMPRDGGPYVYTREAFGPLVGFTVTWSYWISLWIGNAAIATASVSYLGAFFPVFNGTSGAAPLAACAVTWALTLLNIRGVRSAGRFQLVTTLIKLVPLTLVVVLAAWALGAGKASLPPLHDGEITPGAVTAAATLTLWALLGLESATVPAGKIEDPERTVPFATMVGTAGTGLVYLLTSSAIILLMPRDVIAGSGAPFSDFVAHYWAAGPALAVAGFAAISCVGALNGWILVQAELPYAMARNGAFPEWFGKETRHGTPGRALVVSSLLMTIVILLNYQRSAAEIFQFLILLSTATTLFMYLACMLAALRLSGKGRLARSTLLPTVAVIAAAYSLWTIYGAGGEAVGWGLLLLAAAIPAYYAMKLAKGRDTVD
ncbi:amino acid permease [Erythrobacter sp. SG61-1L]|uniref:amino acid permease n=1 Tax=Erythrobacter sp. SG61-1L TaxID=1603897 RepID=UPI0006C8FE0C|nr:amino acid permease [Erythrobacter sp. SG61-1L]KPL66823.1 amino acid permease [Erythrobacter sp. SG61-1L]